MAITIKINNFSLFLLFIFPPGFYIFVLEDYRQIEYFKQNNKSSQPGQEDGPE